MLNNASYYGSIISTFINEVIYFTQKQKGMLLVDILKDINSIKFIYDSTHIKKENIPLIIKNH